MKKYKSITTDIFHERPEQFLAELIMTNRYDGLPAYFWRMDKYKKVYVMYMSKIRDRLKNIDFDVLHKVISENKVKEVTYVLDKLVLSLLKEQQ